MRPRLVHFFEGMVGTGFFVPDYALMFSIAVVSGMWLCVRQAERSGLDPSRVFRAGIVALAGAFLGARLFAVAPHAGFYLQRPWDLVLGWEGGAASSGAYLGGAIAAVAAARRQRLSPAVFLDCCAPGAALAISLGRIGCFLNGCDYGTASGLPWAVRFPVGSWPQEDQVVQGLIRASDPSLPVHPTQLYESLYAAAIFVLLLLYRRRQRHAGELFALLFILYPIGRFLNEFLRGDNRSCVFGLSLPQVFSLFAVILAVSFLVINKSGGKREVRIPAGIEQTGKE